MLKGLLPQMGQSQQAQQQAMARILNYTQRVKDEYDVANENFGAVDAKTGQPNYKILYKNPRRARCSLSMQTGSV